MWEGGRSALQTQKKDCSPYRINVLITGSRSARECVRMTLPSFVLFTAIASICAQAGRRAGWVMQARFTRSKRERMEYTSELKPGNSIFFETILLLLRLRPILPL